LQRGGPSIAAFEELRVRQPQCAIDDCFPIRIQGPRSS